MGVDIRLYNGLYVDINNELNDDNYEDKFELYDDSKLDFIYDGMCGKYAYIGKTFGSFEDIWDIDGIVEIDVDSIDDYKHWIVNMLNELGISVSSNDIKLIMFAHYH